MAAGSTLEGVVAKEPRVIPGTALRWEAHKEETRRRLLASARQLFGERGFEATSAADIAAGAGVTERTLFRYFPSKAALLLDEVISLFPDLFEMIRERPAEEAPYEAVFQGIVQFVRGRDLLFVQVVRAPGAVDLPLPDLLGTLIDFENALATVLHDRYELPPEDQMTAAVWARSSIGALRTALEALARARTVEGFPGKGFADTLRASFAALAGSSPEPRMPAAAGDSSCPLV